MTQFQMKKIVGINNIDGRNNSVYEGVYKGIPRKFFKLFNENESETGRIKVSRKLMKSYAERKSDASELSSQGKITLKVRGSVGSLNSIKSRKNLQSIGYEDYEETSAMINKSIETLNDERDGPSYLRGRKVNYNRGVNMSITSLQNNKLNIKVNKD